MTTKSPSHLILKAIYFLSILLFFSYSSPARAETVTCQEVVPPAVIDTSGEYCLLQNHSLDLLTGSAVFITASDVLLDLNGYGLTNTAGPGNLSVGIFTSPDLENVTVKNGSIEKFYIGVFIQDSGIGFDIGGQHLMEDLTFEGSTYIAIVMRGRGNTARRNFISNTGGVTAIIPSSYGIISYGPFAKIYGNIISNTFGLNGQGSAFGIAVNNNPEGTQISGNRVINTGKDSADAYGIAVRGIGEGTAPVIISNNKVGNSYSTRGYIGISGEGLDKVICFDNGVIGYEIAYNACKDGGLNLP